MKTYKSQQSIGQLEKRKGGYFFLKIEADIINQFQNKRHTRFLCTLEDQLTFPCGLNHLGDGNFFIILSRDNLVCVQKKLGDIIHFELNEDPNPLGVDMPEVLEAVIEQDEQLKAIFESLTLGKKRNIIHQIIRIKDIDKQIQKSINLIKESL
jgi:Bacteriocin-protection, YdeI or OmpD-Associated